MEDDYLKKIEFLGFTARLKRLSDSLVYDAKAVYKELNIEIEPNWHLIILLLAEEKKLSVTEISKRLGFSHPAIIKITKKMKEKGFLNSTTDVLDSRKQLLSLSKKTTEELPILEKYWEVGKNTIQEILEDDSEILQHLSQIEQKLNIKSYKERALHNYKND